MKNQLSALLVLLTLLSCEKQPNVILILTDDQGYGDIAAHGNPWVQTPTLDRLHEQSVCLTNFHVDPCCAPSRAALLTGQYSSRTGVWHTIGGRSLLGTNNVTMAEAFSAAGYQTAIFGKWHLGENYPFRPTDRGFQHAVIHGGGVIGANPDLSTNDYYDDRYLVNGELQQFEGYCNTVWFTEAARYIEANKDQPFFCYIATNLPHAPLLVDSSYIRPYTDQVPDRLPAYYGMITRMDEDLGQFLDRMEKINILDNTILIFMTDNGPCPWFGGIIIDEAGFPLEGYSCGMRGGKIWGYENAHRVPCYISWPDGGIGGGREVSSLTAHLDIFPTLADWCGLEIPSDAGFDGQSLNPLLRHNEAPADRILFVHNQRVDHPVKYKEYQVLTEQWRLLNRDTLELYDILKDPEQKHNMLSGYPDVVARLTREYERWWQHISPGFDSWNRIILGSDQQNPSKIYAHDAHREEGQPHFYMVHFEQDGQYELTPFLYPEESGRSLSGSRVSELHVHINDEEHLLTLSDDTARAQLTVTTGAGPATLRIWFQRNENMLNPHSIQIKRL